MMKQDVQQDWPGATRGASSLAGDTPGGKTPERTPWEMTVASWRCVALQTYYTPGRTARQLMGRLRRLPAGLLRRLRAASAHLIRRAQSAAGARRRRTEKVPPRPDTVRTPEPDYYAILGLPPGSSIERIRAQFRRLARMHHPDLKGGDPFWEEHFKNINVAREYLSDPARKADYDQRWAPQSKKKARPGPH